ncbi:MAG: sulfur carrier protein ThiS [Candidatus Electrothrix gigas]
MKALQKFLFCPSFFLFPHFYIPHPDQWVHCYIAMHIILNGEQTAIKSQTLDAMIAEQGVSPDTVIAEVNLELIKKDDWAQTYLAEGDKVELLSFVGGG